MAIAATGTNSEQGRTVTIQMQRMARNKFVGMRTYVSEGKIVTSELMNWEKQPVQSKNSS